MASRGRNAGRFRTNCLQSAIRNGYLYLRYWRYPRLQFYVVAVPACRRDNNPRTWRPLWSRAQRLKVVKGILSFYESTIAFRGAVLKQMYSVCEKFQAWSSSKDFFAGYSLNVSTPGIKNIQVEKIKKVTSVSTRDRPNSCKQGLCLGDYGRGACLAPTIQGCRGGESDWKFTARYQYRFRGVVVEDIHPYGIDTQDVLEAASTKWNFLQQPGLVGGLAVA